MAKWVKRARLGLLLAIILTAGGVALLAFHPVTGPEIRAYIRDRYLRRGARLPD